MVKPGVAARGLESKQISTLAEETKKEKAKLRIPDGTHILYVDVSPMKGSIGQKSQIREVHPDAGRCGCMRLHRPASKRIEAHSARIWVHINS